MQLVVEHGLGQQVQDDTVGDPVAVEAETVSPRFWLVWVGSNPAIVCPGWVCDADSEGFGEHTSISTLESAFVINIVLCIWHVLAQGDLLAFMVSDWNLVGLVSTGPDHQVCILKVLGLLFHSRSFDQLNSLFCTTFDVVVQLLGITSESRIGVHEAIWVPEHRLTELSVPSLLGLGHSAVEHSDLVSVEYLDIGLLKVRWQVEIVVKVPILVLEVAEAFAQTAALRTGFLLAIVTSAAVHAVWDRLERGVRYLGEVVRIQGVVAIEGGWTMQHDPRR